MDKHSLSLLIVCLFMMSGLTGCTMCQPCELDSYSAYGGRWHRTDRTNGKVASVFRPAGAQVPYDAAESLSDEEISAEEAVGDAEGEDMPSEVIDSVPESEVESVEEALREASLIDEMLGQDY